MPAGVRALAEPVPCRAAGESTVEGLARGIDATVAGGDFAVTASTAGGTDPALLRAALTEGRRIRVTVTCDGDQFLAQRLALLP